MAVSISCLKRFVMTHSSQRHRSTSCLVRAISSMTISPGGMTTPMRQRRPVMFESACRLSAMISAGRLVQGGIASLFDPANRKPGKGDLFIALALEQTTHGVVWQRSQATVTETAGVKYPRHGPGFSLIATQANGSIRAAAFGSWIAEQENVLISNAGMSQEASLAHWFNENAVGSGGIPRFAPVTAD